MKYRLLELSDKDAATYDKLEDPRTFVHNALNGVGGPYGEPKSVDWSKAQEFPVRTKPIKTPKVVNVQKIIQNMIDDNGPTGGNPTMSVGVIKSPKDAENKIGYPE